MITIAIRVREIVSGNVDTLVSKAGEPRKMLRLLQSEVEETLIALHGDVSRARRQRERLLESARRLETGAEGWTAKAKVAMDHGREDLARAALLARESERAKAADEQAEAERLAAQVAEAESIIAGLEAKRSAISARIAQLPGPAAATSQTAETRAIDRRLDRIDALDRRAGFAEGAGPETVDPDAIEKEIASLGQASAIEAELAAMKSGSAAKGAGGKKRG
jgi:phage shock protein A